MSHTSFSMQRELLLVVVIVVLSMVLLPGLIYLVGGRLFGAYGTAGGVGQIYLAMLGDLAVPRFAAWTLLLGPALCVLLLRVLFHLTQDPVVDAVESPANPRREPRVGS